MQNIIYIKINKYNLFIFFMMRPEHVFIILTTSHNLCSAATLEECESLFIKSQTFDITS